MTRLAYALLGALLSLGGVSAPRLRAAAPADPSFQEIYEVLRSHLAGLDEAELNRAAVEGLLARLRGRALFATNPAQAQAEPTGPIDHDVIACEHERPGMGGEALLEPVILGGKLVKPLPDPRSARDHAADCVRRLPAALRSLHQVEEAWRTDYSPEMLALLERVRGQHNGGEA